MTKPINALVTGTCLNHKTLQISDASDEGLVLGKDRAWAGEQIHEKQQIDDGIASKGRLTAVLYLRGTQLRSAVLLTSPIVLNSRGSRGACIRTHRHCAAWIRDWQAQDLDALISARKELLDQRLQGP